MVMSSLLAFSNQLAGDLNFVGLLLISQRDLGYGNDSFQRKCLEQAIQLKCEIFPYNMIVIVGKYCTLVYSLDIKVVK